MFRFEDGYFYIITNMGTILDDFWVIASIL